MFDSSNHSADLAVPRASAVFRCCQEWEGFRGGEIIWVVIEARVVNSKGCNVEVEP